MWSIQLGVGAALEPREPSNKLEAVASQGASRPSDRHWQHVDWNSVYRTGQSCCTKVEAAAPETNVVITDILHARLVQAILP